MRHARLVLALVPVLTASAGCGGGDKSGGAGGNEPLDGGFMESNETLTLTPCTGPLAADFVEVRGLASAGGDIVVKVGYSGGCKMHDFSLCFGAIEDGATPQAKLSIGHNANGDTCKRLVAREISFDAAALRKAFADKYRKTSGALLLRLDPQYLEYTF